MFSGPSDVSMVDLLDSCSSIEPSPPVWTPSPKPVQSSTPNSVSTSNIEPSLPLHTPSPKLIHSNTSNSTEPSQPLAHSTTLKTTTNSCSKRKALFPQEEPVFLQLQKQGCPTTCPFQTGFPSELRKPLLLIMCCQLGGSSLLTSAHFIMLWANTQSRETTREWLLQSVTNFLSWEIPIHQATGYVCCTLFCYPEFRMCTGL